MQNEDVAHNRGCCPFARAMPCRLRFAHWLRRKITERTANINDERIALVHALVELSRHEMTTLRRPGTCGPQCGGPAEENDARVENMKIQLAAPR